MIALSAVQSTTETFVYNDSLFIDTSNNAWYNQAHWLRGMPYLSIISSYDLAIVDTTHVNLFSFCEEARDLINND